MSERRPKEYGMTPFEELSYLGRIRRMRQLAQSAVKAYGLSNARLTFVRQAGNTIYRVWETSPGSSTADDLYAPGQYMLRIHDPDYQRPTGIELELAWLASMRRESDLPVPEPVLTADGKLITRASVPGIPGERVCSLLRWVKGGELKRGEIRPAHYKALGELMARLHTHAAHWEKPAGLSKRNYDWAGLFRKTGEDGKPSSEAWSLLPVDYVKPFEIVAKRMKQTMDAWGKGPDVYGLIHGDLGMEANVLFWNGTARIIDFDDSGFGYYLFDLSIVLEDSQEDQIRPEFREALLDGYTQIRPLTEGQIKSLDLFLAAYAVYWSLFAADAVRFHPEDREEIYERMGRYLKLVKNHLAKNWA
jgi:Ser/Thr protein kinase RdoA (MazF antagonist)